MLIKIASTWEGIRAAEILEREGIQTNLTLLFSFAQAVACADAGVFLISPFVGRIYDWYKKSENRDYAGAEDPGVQSVSRIYRYYKANGYKTVVMGASFRNLGQIEQLAGCDRLTISPDLLQQLADAQGELPRLLLPGEGEPRQVLDESAFRWQMNEDAMATEKLAEHPPVRTRPGKARIPVGDPPLIAAAGGRACRASRSGTAEFSRSSRRDRPVNGAPGR